MLSINGAAASGTTSPTPSGSVRHHTREHAQLTGNFLGGTGFGSQSPAAGHSNFANSDFSSFLEGVMTEEERRTRTRQLPEVEGFNILSKSGESVMENVSTVLCRLTPLTLPSTTQRPRLTLPWPAPGTRPSPTPPRSSSPHPRTLRR